MGKYGICNFLQRLMYIMLTQDKPGCMEDAIEVMKSCGVKLQTGLLYTFRLRQLIATDRVRSKPYASPVMQK